MLNEARQGGFAAAGFAHNAENLPTLHVKGHPVHSFHLGLDGVQDATTYREVFAQCSDRQERLARLRETRDKTRAARALDALGKGAEDSQVNTMPLLIECARADCTLGEMCDVMRDVFGVYREDSLV